MGAELSPDSGSNNGAPQVLIPATGLGESVLDAPEDLLPARDRDLAVETLTQLHETAPEQGSSPDRAQGGVSGTLVRAQLESMINRGRRIYSSEAYEPDQGDPHLTNAACLGKSLVQTGLIALATAVVGDWKYSAAALVLTPVLMRVNFKHDQTTREVELPERRASRREVLGLPDDRVIGDGLLEEALSEALPIFEEIVQDVSSRVYLQQLRNFHRTIPPEGIKKILCDPGQPEKFKKTIRQKALRAMNEILEREGYE